MTAKGLNSAIVKAAEYALSVIDTTNRFDPAQCEEAAIRALQGDARKRYADAEGLLVRPSMATLRKVLEQ